MFEWYIHPLLLVHMVFHALIWLYVSRSVSFLLDSECSAWTYWNYTLKHDFSKHILYDLSFNTITSM